MKIIKTAKYKKQAEDVSAQEVFNQNMKFYNNDERKAVEATLSMMTGGLFDAVEGGSREKFINEAIRKWVRREVPVDTPMGLEEDNPVQGIDY